MEDVINFVCCFYIHSFIFRIGEVFEIKSGIVGSHVNIYEDNSSTDEDLPSDISEHNGILPSKIKAKENSAKPNTLISFDDDRNYHQNEVISKDSKPGYISHYQLIFR